ncbi:HAMP domain-containing protein [Cohnella sp. CFH 77786]|nr:HAMP domain-containing protein [Cohnella sp. CFH 77786]
MLRLDDMPLQKKLIAAYVVVILVPIILFSMITFNRFAGSTIRDIIDKNKYMLENELTNIVNNMELMERTATLMITNDNVEEYLLRSSEPEANELITFNTETFKSLQNLHFNNPKIENIRLFTNNPNAFELWPIIFHESRIANESWYRDVLSRKGVVHWEINRVSKDLMDRYLAERDDTQINVSLMRGINYTSEHDGIAEVSMTINSFVPKMFASNPVDQSQLLLYDRNGMVYGNTAAPFFANLSMDEIKRHFAANLGDGATDFRFSYNGLPYLCVYTKIDRLDAYMLSIVPLENTINEIRDTRNLIILAAVVLIVLLSVITYVMYSFILKKLHSLQGSMKKVRQGDFNIDLDIRGSGEVGELAHHFRKMVSKINELIADAVNKQAATKEAELKSLKNQIDSHFLYNTLENLKMLAEIEGQYTISDALTSLGGMMRYSMKWTSNQVRLSDEIAHIKNYISIMNIRYDGRLSLKLDIPADYMNQEVPKMSLQPIVENALKHGLTSQAEGLIIAIRCLLSGGAMLIEVSDNGTGMPAAQVQEVNANLRMNDESFYGKYGNKLKEEEKESGGSGIGLRNVTQRIMMYCGNEYGMRIDSQEGAGTTVTIKLPYSILSGGLTTHAKRADRG